MQLFDLPKEISQKDSLIGIFMAIAIFSLSILSLILLLPDQPSNISSIELLIFIFVRTFLHTGLFIIAHDAMHINLVPVSKKINNLIGHIAVYFYAALPYNKCRINHQKHHQNPAQDGDPDFHDGINSHPLIWYLKFIKEYLSINIIINLAIKWCLIFWAANQLFYVSLLNFTLFWIIPLILSSIQLFFFGTYLPHRENPQKSNSMHSSRTNRSYLVSFSFLTCYHFGFYHKIHHDYPKMPWYKLPSVKGSLNI